MTAVTITFIDGTTEEVRAYKVTFDDWERYPLSNIKKWSTK